MDGGEEGLGIFSVAGSDAAPSLEMQEGVFNQMTQFIELFVVRPLLFSVFLRRDHGVHPLLCGLLQDGICIVAFIRDQMIGIHPLDQAGGLGAIRAGTFCNKDSDRHTKRIHGQVYLGVEPPFVRLMA